MGTPEIFYTGLASTPSSIGLRRKCIVNNQVEFLVIEETKINNPKSSQDRKQYQRELKRLKEKYSL